MIIPSDKTPRAVRFSKFISQSPLACLGSRVQGSRAFSPVENSFQNLLDEVFCDLVCTAHLQYILNFDLLRSVGGGQVLRHRGALLSAGGPLRHRQQAARRPRPHPERRHRRLDGDFLERVGDEISGSKFGKHRHILEILAFN